MPAVSQKIRIGQCFQPEGERGNFLHLGARLRAVAASVVEVPAIVPAPAWVAAAASRQRGYRPGQ